MQLLAARPTNCAPSHTNECALIPSVLFDLDIVRRSRNKPKTGLSGPVMLGYVTLRYVTMGSSGFDILVRLLTGNGPWRPQTLPGESWDVGSLDLTFAKQSP
eukprot:1656881-Prymnesium_polylepis.1